MKYLEKAIQLRPDLTEEEVLKSCPVSFGIMKYRCETFADYCSDCWNRQMPEPKVNLVPKVNRRTLLDKILFRK